MSNVVFYFIFRGHLLQGLGQSGINTVLARLEEAQARLHPQITDPVRDAIKTVIK
jgi:hypothetical protein